MFQVNEEGDVSGYAILKGIVGRTVALVLAKAKESKYNFRQLYWWDENCIKLSTIIYKRENVPKGANLTIEEKAKCERIENSVSRRISILPALQGYM